MNIIKKIGHKYKDGQLIETILWRLRKTVLDPLKKLGFIITPFYLYEEGLSGDIWKSRKDNFDQYEIGFLSPPDMKEIAALSRGDWASEEELLARLKDGHKCFGAKYQGKIVAFTWSGFERCQYRNYGFPLRGDEAYLWDAFTIPSLRGKGIAPYLRFKFYEELQKLGRNTFYSITLCSNKPALRFKKKLNAKPLILAIYIRLLKKRSWSWKIKNYRYDMH